MKFNKLYSRGVFVTVLIVVFATVGFLTIRIYKNGNSSGTISTPLDIPKTIPPAPSQKPKPVLSSDPEEFLQGLKNASEKAKNTEDYLQFAQLLKTVYEKGLDKNQQFMAVESDLYLFTDKEYFIKGNYNKSLEFSTVVYNQVFQSGRFLYLRVLSLEALGREAFKKNDLQAAEQYARTILQMTYRLEGANLLADIYIKKIRDKMKSGDIESAQRDLDYIIDFQVSDDRKTILIALMEELSSFAQNRK